MVCLLLVTSSPLPRLLGLEFPLDEDPLVLAVEVGGGGAWRFGTGL